MLEKLNISHPCSVNPLELFQDSNVSDVLIEGTREILIDLNGELTGTALSFESEYQTLNFAKDLLVDTNTRFDLNMPFGESNIETEYGKLRIHCVHGGECSADTLISIRRHPSNQLSLMELQVRNFINGEQLSQLLEITKTKKNFVIGGATGTGKTTLLRAMLTEVQNERIITIEDSAELNLQGKAISLFTRARNQDGYGGIGLTQLVRQSLRMRPDRIVLGEARGKELKVLLGALNTGHQGAGFTLHANSTHDVVTRLETLLAMAGIDNRLAHQLIASSLDYVLEVRRVQGTRKLMEIRPMRELYV